MVSRGLFLRRLMLLASAALCLVVADVFAAFGGLVPLHWSGQLAYNYGYVDSAGNESESTGLMLGMNASGYVWQPWFATTSMALNVGLTNTETASSSSDATTASGNFSLGVFVRSRFPFSVSYSRSDSRSQSFRDVSQTSFDTAFTVTRMSIRQQYRPRAYNQSYNAWFNTTEYDAASFGSESTVYGLNYLMRVSGHSVSLNAGHNEAKVRGDSAVTSTDSVSLSHVYTPAAELGVSSLATYARSDPGIGTISKEGQLFSSFYWRPEHRAVNISGGVRLTEAKSEGAETRVGRSLSTNLALGYRLTRALRFSASAAVGTADSGGTQTLSTSETAAISYSGAQLQIAGFSYTWQMSGGAANSAVRTEVGGETITSDRQSLNTGFGHNISKSWAPSRNSSLNGGFSQSVSGAKSSGSDVVSKTLSQGMQLGWNARGRRGSLFLSGRVSDSRGYGERDTVFTGFGANMGGDYAVNRLSSMSGNVSYSANSSQAEDAVGEVITSSSKHLNGGMAYRHGRPFGVYNLRFTANLRGSRQIGSAFPSSTLRLASQFQYSLGLLTAALGLNVSESAGGFLTKSMNFQATRSF